MKILVLNAGSSTQKSYVYEIGDMLPETAPEPLWEGLADWGKSAGKSQIQITTKHGKQEYELSTDQRIEVVERLLSSIWSGQDRVVEDPLEIAIVGHRVVHGGPRYSESVPVTPEVKQTIQDLFHFAPLHNPANLEGITAVEKILPQTPQVAAFDTAFHRRLPLESRVYPGPYWWYEQEIQRYGFHGISLSYCTRRVAQLLRKDEKAQRLIICHLGNGCSVSAIQNGHSLDTTMGFTPLEGVMMGTRSGTVDPSILIYLMRQQKETADGLEKMLNKESGLKGISGVSSDLREVLKARDEGNERAKLAFDLYIHRLRGFIGSMLPVLNGLDALVFTGGVGENSSDVRAATCESLAFMGLKLDEQQNAKSPADTVISTQDSSTPILLVHTLEDWEIARECWQLAQSGKVTPHRS